MKKTWIKIKRGLLEPKHRERLGIRIWLYLYILDNTDWEIGQIREWRDKAAADEMQMPVRTLTQQRQQLADDEYITCEVAGNKQIITIHNYTNPRKYDGEVANPKGEGTRNHVPLQVGGTNEGTREGTNKGLSKPRTPSYKPQITNHIPEEEDNIFTLYESSIGLLTKNISDELVSLEDDYPKMWIEDAFAIAKKNKATHLKYVTAILTRWNANGKDDGYKPKGKKKTVDMSAFDRVREEMKNNE